MMAFLGWVDILKRYALQKFHEGNGDELILFNLESAVKQQKDY
jgi:hypothetical protein